MSKAFTLLTAATGTGASPPMNTAGRGVTFQIVAGAGGTSAVIRTECSANGTDWTPVSSTDDTNTTAAAVTALPSTFRLMTPAGPTGIDAISYWRVNVTANTGGVPVTVLAQVGEG